MLEVLFSTGMRISELVNLKRSQIDDSGKIFIEGKGKKQRFVYMTDRARQHVDNYLAVRSDMSEYLFIPYRGSRSGSINRRVSTNYLQMKIKSIVRYFGLMFQHLRTHCGMDLQLIWRSLELIPQLYKSFLVMSHLKRPLGMCMHLTGMPKNS